MTERVRTVFLGSGAFAVPVVERVARHPDLELRAVVTAPPRAAGRGGGERPSPVGAWALDGGLPVLTPQRLRAPDSVAAFAALLPELVVLADYGQIVPGAILDLPHHGALNLHPSLLPRHRGATPIPAAILAGDRETGVSLMRMDAGLDTGPLIAQRRTPIGRDETAPELEARLAEMAAELLVAELPGWLAGATPATPQPSEGATLTRPYRRADGRLDPTRPAAELERQVRALKPWPGSFLDTTQGRVLVHGASAIAGSQPSGGPSGPPDTGVTGAPGTLVGTPDGGLALVTTDGALELHALQPAGGRPMSAPELLRGRPALLGSVVVDT